jgi:hypothetical protein
MAVARSKGKSRTPRATFKTRSRVTIKGSKAKTISTPRFPSKAGSGGPSKVSGRRPVKSVSGAGKGKVGRLNRPSASQSETKR